VVNSEEFARSPDFARLVKCSSKFKSSAIFAIGGSTHPSFSDINLILPPCINRLIGLRARPELIFMLSIQAVMLFFHHGLEQTKALASGTIPSGEAPFKKNNVLLVHKEDLHPVSEISLPVSKSSSADC
jgi:hypothetical protein